MARSKLGIIIISLFLLLLVGVNPLAAQTTQGVFFVDESWYFSHDQECIMDAKPFMNNGRVYVPVRYLAYVVDVTEDNIYWDDGSKTLSLSKDGIDLFMIWGSNDYYINNTFHQMDVTPLIVDGRLYLPARYVAEAFGYRVAWDEINQSVEIISDGSDQEISVDQALDIVKHLPEVEELIVTSGIDGFMQMEDTYNDQGRLCYVFEAYKDFQDKILNVNYFYVDKVTGEATKALEW